MSRFFLFAVFTVVSAATVHRMEAVFKELTMKPDGSGVDHIKLEYSEETKKNLQQILETRASQLTGVYCKGMTELMVVYARDHASQFNATDIYDVSTKILESLKGRDVFTPVIEACQKDNTTASVGSAEKRQALLTLLCVTSSIERERDALNAIEMVWRWSVNSKTDAALADLSTMFSCPQAMMKLALYQLDVEYKRDGVAKVRPENVCVTR
jgi:hypothetical protein